MFNTKMLKMFAREIAPALRVTIREAIAEHTGVAPRYFGLEQAAQYLSTTQDGVRGMLRAKRFPTRQLGKGGRVFIDRNDIDKAMSENVHWLEK
jgi:hypothetical protein